MKGFSSATLWIIVFLFFIWLFMNFHEQEKPVKLTLTEWLDKGEQGLIVDALDNQGELTGEFKTNVDSQDANTKYKSNYLPGQAEFIVQWAREHKIPYDTKEKNTLLGTMFLSIFLPVILIVVLWLFLMRQLQGGGNKAMSFGKSKAKLVKEGEIKITFKDVAGVDEAREELQEIVDYLKDPKKFSRLGGRIPKGVLLIGPPGTGKTLMAKAIAGEAGVPFFSISGSDFVEMFVGVGASRVRDLFEQAKKAKPCIIFIDEIDAVGRSRFAGMGGGHDEREQTLNQLLVEMDGFVENEGVILIAATNRPDVLDPALLRPGRFDRQVTVGLPDIRGREKILKVHVRNVRIGAEVNLSQIAKGTPGFSGADLANLINEAALLAARRNRETVSIAEFEEAKDRVMMGPERRSMVISDEEKKKTAYHEVGHALVGHFAPESDPVHKITIVPRGRALGVTWSLPQEDRHSHNRRELISTLHRLMGGRAAEILMFDEVSTGAASDIDRATNIAYQMVCVFGMSDRLGPRAFHFSGGDNIFLAKDMARDRNFSEETAAIIDEEVKRLIDDSHDYSIELLTEHKDLLIKISEVLIERETLDREEFLKLLEGQELPPMELGAPPEPPSAGAPEAAAEEGKRGKANPLTGLGGPDPQPST